MEKIEIAALSQIADILSDSEKSPIVPEEDVWKKIFYNAELGEMFEERKKQARKLGEEAGTKLLFPMILQLGIVMIIVIAPALLGF